LEYFFKKALILSAAERVLENAEVEIFEIENTHSKLNN